MSIRGRVAAITTERVDLHFKQLNQRNPGHEEYRYGRSGQVRVLLTITLEKLL